MKCILQFLPRTNRVPDITKLRIVSNSCTVIVWVVNWWGCLTQGAVCSYGTLVGDGGGGSSRYLVSAVNAQTIATIHPTNVQPASRLSTVIAVVLLCPRATAIHVGKK